MFSASRSWRRFCASFAVKKHLTAKNAKESQSAQSKPWARGAETEPVTIRCDTVYPVIRDYATPKNSSTARMSVVLL